MSSKTGKKSKGKAVDKSSDWSEWIWDAPNKRHYRGRSDSKGSFEYEYQYQEYSIDTSEQTPRSETGSDTATTYNSNTTSSGASYYGNDAYVLRGSQASSAEIDTVSTTFRETSISSTNQPLVAQSPSYNDPSGSTGTSGTSDPYGYNTVQPIPIQSSPTRSNYSGDRAYSSSAPVGGYMNFKNSSTHGSTDTKPNQSSFGAIDIGYFPEDSSGYYQSSQGTNISPHGNQNTQAVADDYSATPAEIGGSSATYGSGSIDAAGSAPAIEKQIHKKIKGSNRDKGKTEKTTDKKLHQDFKIHHSRSFKPGDVFKILWTEPRGETFSNATDVTPFAGEDTIQYGEKAHSSIRRFVIVAGDRGHCQCLPILTYRRQGTAKSGVKGDDHAIVYVGDYPPLIGIGENISRPSIQMIPKTPQDKLDPFSRINYAKIYTVEHNVKVHFIGHIEKNSMFQLMKDFDDAWNKKRQISYY